MSFRALSYILVGLKRYKTFPLDVLIDALKGPVLLLIIPSLWYGIGAVGSFSLRELFLYTAASHLLVLLPIYVSFPVANMIRTGFLPSLLTKPVNLSSYLFLRNLGSTFVSLVSSLLVFAVIYKVYGGVNIALFFLGLSLAVVFYLLLGQIIGYLATWFYTIWGFQSILVYLPSLLFGGSLVPLDLLPSWLVDVASFLPWKSLHYDVAMIVLGRSPNFLPLLLWIAFLAVLERIVFHVASKRWESWGG